MTIWRSDDCFPRDTRGLSMHLIVAFHFITLVHPPQPLHLLTREQFFKGMHDWDHLMVERCTETALSGDNVAAILQPFTCRNNSLCPNHFRTLFVNYRVSGSPKNCFRQLVRVLLWRPNQRWAVCHPSDNPFFFSTTKFLKPAVNSTSPYF